MGKLVRKDIFEIHKPSAMISAEYHIPIKVGRKIKQEQYVLTPVQHDAMNYMCYQAREQINRRENIEQKFKSFKSDEDLFKFLEIQDFDLNLKEFASFVNKYESKQNKKELSSLLDILQSVQVKVGIFKQDSLLGDIHSVTTMSLLRKYKRITNSTIATFQLEPEILLGWIHKTKPFAKMYLKVQTILKLTYSKILYEVCKDYANMKKIDKPFSEWLRVLGFKSTLTAAKTVSQLKQGYLNKAIKEINDNTDIKINKIYGRKKNGKTSMIVEFESQKCELIETKTHLINNHKFYNKSKSKLNNLVKNGYKVIDEDMWIETDIKKNEDRYDAEVRIDKWLKETDQETQNDIYKILTESLDNCDDPMVLIEDYKLIGIFTKETFTKNPKETIEIMNKVIESLN